MKPRRKTNPALPPAPAHPAQAATPAIKSHSRWRVAVAIYGILLFVVSVVPTRAVGVQHLDKLVHLCEYLVFAWLLVRALIPIVLVEGHVERRAYCWWAWIYATSYGWLIELVQAMLPWRSADIADGLANALGAALGVLLGRQFPKKTAEGPLSTVDRPQSSL